MTSGETPSNGATVATIGLGVVALLFWLVSIAILSDLGRSDAAGNAIEQAYAAIALFILWGLLGAMALIVAINGVMPRWVGVAALVLVVGSGFAAFAALDLLSHPFRPPHKWPLVVPVMAPVLIAGFCIGSMLPQIEQAIPLRILAIGTLGMLLAVSLSIWPLLAVRKAVIDREDQVRTKYEADLASLPKDAPLWDWVPFFDTRNDSRKNDVLDGIKHLARRQADAETLLERGDFPLGYLGRMDLDPSPALCDKARALLRKNLEPLVLQPGETKPYKTIFWPVNDALAAMKWLIGYDCDVTPEAAAWEKMANAYSDTNFDVVELRALRDPNRLGNIVRQYPERFSQLTPKAHLKAWLSFADKPDYRQQALEGARKLDHRNADAVEMLRDKTSIGAPFMAMKNISMLDLEATPELCAAALAIVRDDIAKTYRPKPDDPRSYDELLGRLGGDEPLDALLWLSGKGCDTEAQLTDAESLVRSYRGSADSRAMLAALAKAHRKPQ